MKKPILFLIALVLSAYSLMAQQQEDYSDLVKVGDELLIDTPSASSYQHINVPRKNFIIKRGGVPDMKTLKSSVVTVTKISNDENPIITFKKANGKKFFRVYKTLTADLNSAVASGEIQIRERGNKKSMTK
ncbi:hypothetical protein KIM67_08320 [Flagellimonas sp. 389]|uniref:hypothetical protein n=1 Tax=Flagellimonas sp. 389 TaxID=2835862 RepID=UPI001BD1DDF0|nr:hypothetical protein [Flagellimonas sp. 389]MBS9462411.1 hypothetical protein [Flagellimonas sp. 389]